MIKKFKDLDKLRRSFSFMCSYVNRIYLASIKIKSIFRLVINKNVDNIIY